MSGVLVVGSLNLDMVITVPRIPLPGENVHGRDFSMVPGGKGGNQAVAAARMGREVHLLGCVGRDPSGEFLVEALETWGIDTGLVRTVERHGTGTALIAVEERTGMNTIAVDPGANMAMTIDDLDVLERCYGECRAALFQLEIPLDVVSEGARRAGAAGLMTVLDAGPPRGARLDLAKSFDVVSPNERELASLTGREPGGVESALDAARELVDAGVGIVVVKMGASGALVVTERVAEHLPALPVEAVDSTGAGDAFTAGLAVALCDGLGIVEAAAFANAAGACAVKVPGAMPSMPARGDVLAMLDGKG